MATIKDVAREAGVSIATVSRVFNHSKLVSEATQAKVRKVAGRLNFWPNGAARSLITSKSQAIGVLLPDLFGEFFSEVLHGIDRSARAVGLHLLVSSSHADTDELIAALRAMHGRIDGLIVMTPDVDADAAIRATRPDFPLVLIDPGSQHRGFDTISIDNHDGAYALVRHLAGLGHRRIAMVTGPKRNTDAQRRLEGYRAALRDWKLPVSREFEIQGDFTEPSGYNAVPRLLELHPSAVFTANDYTAVGVMGGLSDAGVRVPEDIAVAGFDDIPIARYLNPPLTTVHVDAFRLGEMALQRLLKANTGSHSRTPHRRSHEVLPVTLVVRGSCGASIERARVGTGRTRGR